MADPPLMKNVDGVEVPLTPDEIAEYNARQQAWQDAEPKRQAARARADALVNDPERTDLLDKLRNATPAQISTWVDANVTNLADARKMFKIILKALAQASPLD